MRAVERVCEGVEKLSIISDFDFYNLNLIKGLSLQRENTRGRLKLTRLVSRCFMRLSSRSLKLF